jgi:putative transcriptional regulator
MSEHTNDAETKLDYAELLKESLGEMEAIARGEREPKVRSVELTTTREALVSTPPEFGPSAVVALRERLRVSQALFARLLNVSASLVRAWERGARKPDGMALRLLELVSEKPELLEDRLAPAPEMVFSLTDAATGQVKHVSINSSSWVVSSAGTFRRVLSHTSANDPSAASDQRSSGRTSQRSAPARRPVIRSPWEGARRSTLRSSWIASDVKAAAV